MSNSTYHSDVIIIGGGVAGLSTAYQLSKRNVSVTLLERQQLGAGSTGQAAGLLGQLRRTEAATKLMIDSIAIVRELEKETTIEIFVETGSVRLATREARISDTQKQAEWGRQLGLNVSLVDNKELKTLLPYMNCDDILAASFCPTDGHVMPHELVTAYAKIAKQKGVKIVQQSPVRDILIEKQVVKGVKTDSDTYFAPKVLNATGPWSYVIAQSAQRTLPTTGIGHYYLTTKPQPSYPVDKMSPAVRDYDGRIYSRAEAGGLLVGIYEENPIHYDTSKLSRDFVMSSMKAQRDSLSVAHLLESATHRFPLLKEASFRVTTGIMTFTPDGSPLCGEIPGVGGLYHCAGFCGHGIVQSPAVGRIMADLLIEKLPPYDMKALAAARFHDVADYQDRNEIVKHCMGNYAGHYGPLQTT